MSGEREREREQIWGRALEWVGAIPLFLPPPRKPQTVLHQGVKSEEDAPPPRDARRPIQ